MENTQNLGDLYKQVQIGLSLYRAPSERARGRHVHALAMGAEWAAGYVPTGEWAEDAWMWDALREAICENGGAVRRANAGGGFTESYLDGNTIQTRRLDS